MASPQGRDRCARRTTVRWIVAAAAACLILAPSAQGAVTIGSDLKPGVPDGSISNGACLAGPCTSINSVFDPVAQQTSPINGVIVRWRLRQGITNTAGPGSLRVVRVAIAPSVWTGVRTAPAVTLPAPAGTYVFDARLAIGAGDAIGLDHEIDHGVFVVGGAGRDSVYNGTLPNGSTRTEDNGVAAEVLLNADVEADADRDGYGDESQDSCPADATKQTPCKPKITKGPKKKTESRKAKFKFSSAEPGAAFQCAVDKQDFSACTSPKKLKNLAPGKHKFRVRGMDPAGQLGEPAVFKWRISA